MELVDFPYGPQILWPDHCVQKTYGSEFHPELAMPEGSFVSRKGYNPKVDSYRHAKAQMRQIQNTRVRIRARI